MLRKSSLLHDLRLPPTHFRFPAVPLLHAILCVTAAHLPATLLSTRDYWPTGTSASSISHPAPTNDTQLAGALHSTGETFFSSSNSPLSRFQLWHRRHALQGATMSADRGEHFLQLIQTAILVTVTDQYNAWWNDLWQLSGTCIRLAVPMRIHEGGSQHDAASFGFGESGCPGTMDPLEQAEMDRTWWMAYYIERTASMWSTWPLVMADEEITCELPVLQSTFNQGYGELTGIQTIHTPDLYLSHPRLDSFGLSIKSIKLFADSQKFLRFYRRRRHSIERYNAEPEFRLILSHIASLTMSLPPDIRRPTQNLIAGGRLDRDALVVVMLVHATSIVLGEPFLTPDHWQDDMARSLALTPVRSILSLIYDITATSYDLVLLPPTVSYVFFLAAKALLRFIAAATQDGDTLSVSMFRAEIGVFQWVQC